MMGYLKWLFKNTKPRAEATFNLFWFTLYTFFTIIILCQAIEEPRSLWALIIVGLMMYHQWKTYKADIN